METNKQEKVYIYHSKLDNKDYKIDYVDAEMWSNEENSAYGLNLTYSGEIGLGNILVLWQQGEWYCDSEAKSDDFVKFVVNMWLETQVLKTRKRV